MSFKNALDRLRASVKEARKHIDTRSVIESRDLSELLADWTRLDNRVREEHDLVPRRASAKKKLLRAMMLLEMATYGPDCKKYGAQDLIAAAHSYLQSGCSDLYHAGETKVGEEALELVSRIKADIKDYDAKHPEVSV